MTQTTPSPPEHGQSIIPRGLTTAEAHRRLGEVGANAIAEQVPPPWRLFLAKIWGPLPWLLETAIVVQVAVGEYVEASVIGGLLLFNATLGFLQEGRAGAALAALKGKLAPTALVLRDGAWVRLPAAELVPGDVIRLPLGALVPADANLLSGSILVDQSMLTGESIPVDAAAGSAVYSGGIVRRGQAVAEVTATGTKTFFGRTAELVRIAHTAGTEQTSIVRLTRNLAIVNATVTFAMVALGVAMAIAPAELVRLSLTALLASIPVALPAVFTLSSAMSAQTLAQRGVLLTRLSAAHEAAVVDVLCSDKTGTLTSNRLTVEDITALPGVDRQRVLALAAAASSEADQDPIDAAIRVAARAATAPEAGTVRSFTPFDPVTRMSEAVVVEAGGREIRVAKGALHAISEVATIPAAARSIADDLAARGQRVIAVAAGPDASLELIGFLALSDPPREDSAALLAALADLGIRTVMVTGDSPATAAVVAHQVGITGPVCPPELLSAPASVDRFAVFARVLPEQKYGLVKALQAEGHVVGMCGDGVNDAPALRQAELGIAVASATDVAKAAAALVLTEPGLGGIVFAVREGRIAFERLLTYTLNMLVKKIEVVLFLAIGLALTGQAVITPVLMVLLLVTNDFLTMSLTTDRTTAAPAPGAWNLRSVTLAAAVLAACKLGFSVAVLAIGAFVLHLRAAELQTLAFVTLVLGNQSVLYALRERRHLWASRPGAWVVASTGVDIGIVAALALTGFLIAPLPLQYLLAVSAAAAGFAFVVDQVKLPLLAALGIR